MRKDLQITHCNPFILEVRELTELRAWIFTQGHITSWEERQVC